MVRNTISIYLPRLISRHTYGSRHVISCAHAYPHTHRIQNTWRLEGPATAYTCDRAGFRIFTGDRTPIRAVAVRGACLCIATTPLRADRDVVAAAVQQAGGPPHAWPAVHADSQVGTPPPPTPTPPLPSPTALPAVVCVPGRPKPTHPPTPPASVLPPRHRPSFCTALFGPPPVPPALLPRRSAVPPSPTPSSLPFRPRANAARRGPRPRKYGL